MAVSDNVSGKIIKRKKKKTTGDIVFNVFLYTFFSLTVVVILYPLHRILAYSFNDRMVSIVRKVYIFPNAWTLENYKQIFINKPGILRGFLTTALRTVAGTAASLAVNALLAFILSRRKFRFRYIFSLFWVITMYLQGGMIPTYVLYSKLHLRENFLVYIIPGMVNVMYVLVIRTYMKSIPYSLEESAQLEGAGYFKIFTCIISPLCKPVYAATALFTALYHWNSWFDALLYNRHTPELTTLNYEIMKYIVSPGFARTVNEFKGRTSAYWPQITAASVLTAVPVLVVYPFFQRYFISGLKVGGIKD